MWEKFYSRKYNVQRNEILLRSVETDFFKQFKQLRSKVIIIPEDGNEAFFYEKQHWPEFINSIIEVTSKDYETYKRFHELFIEEGEKFVKVCKEIQESLNNSDKQDLLPLYKQYYDQYLSFFSTSIWIIFIIEPKISSDVEQLLQKLNKTEYLGAALAPEKPNIVIQERIDLLKIKSKQELENHFKKYQWIPCYDIDDKPWTLEHFENEHKNLKDPEKELEEIKTKQLENQTQSEKLLQTLNQEQKELIQTTKLISYIKDKRDEHRREGQFYIRSLYGAIGKKLNLNLQQVTYMTMPEIINCLNGKQPDITEIDQRIEGYVYKWEYGTHKLFSGETGKKIVEQEFPKEETISEQLIGKPACLGHATGNAKIIINTKDLHKIEKGDIMVAVSTHPDYVPAMRLSAAIVTDEGGLTCHAAIVSREMNIPCIVGTKNATKVLKDNQKIEVDADKGIVKISSS